MANRNALSQVREKLMSDGALNRLSEQEKARVNAIFDEAESGGGTSQSQDQGQDEGQSQRQQGQQSGQQGQGRQAGQQDQGRGTQSRSGKSE